jgi:hypothetical protein
MLIFLNHSFIYLFRIPGNMKKPEAGKHPVSGFLSLHPEFSSNFKIA